jgi:hypothetical protein
MGLLVPCAEFAPLPRGIGAQLAGLRFGLLMDLSGLECLEFIISHVFQDQCLRAVRDDYPIFASNIEDATMQLIPNDTEALRVLVNYLSLVREE